MKQNSQTLKVAVVGGGAFGEEHLKTFASMPQVEVGGVYTLESERGAELCARYGGRNYASLQELAQDESLSLVSIATPEDRHVEPFKVLAENGKAIYVEKPLATSLDEARQMLEYSRRVPSMSGHLLRFEQRIAAVYQKLRGVEKHHFQFRNRRTRLEKETYGRVHPAYVMQCHEIELSNAFAASTFKRVIAMETHYSPGQVDGISILIEYENGVTSSIEGGWYLPAQSNCIENDFISIVSSQGVDELTMPNLAHFQIDEGGFKPQNSFYGYEVYGVQYGPLRAAFDYFITCIQQNQAPEIATIQDAYNAVELIEAALRSIKENCWIARSEIAPTA
jgi:predicted dehydrogenase